MQRAHDKHEKHPAHLLACCVACEEPAAKSERNIHGGVFVVFVVFSTNPAEIVVAPRARHVVTSSILCYRNLALWALGDKKVLVQCWV